MCSRMSSTVRIVPGREVSMLPPALLRLHGARLGPAQHNPDQKSKGEFILESDQPLVQTFTGRTNSQPRTSPATCVQPLPRNSPSKSQGKMLCLS